jgi:hypothetical protein
MVDETGQYEEVTEAKKNAGELGEEFKRFGQQLGDTVTAAWESDEGRNIRNQIGDALKEMAQQLESVTKKVASREETQKLRSQAEQLVDSVRQSEVAEELQEGLLTGLKELNQALDKAIGRLGQNPQEEDDTTTD